MRKLVALVFLLTGCSGGGFETRERGLFGPIEVPSAEADSGAPDVPPAPTATTTATPSASAAPPAPPDARVVVKHECPEGYDWNDSIGHCLRADIAPPAPETDGGTTVVVTETDARPPPAPPEEPDAAPPTPTDPRTCIEREPPLYASGPAVDVWIVQCCIGESGIAGLTPGSAQVKIYFDLCGPNGLGHATCKGVCDASQAGPECVKIEGTARQYTCP